jgi:hypothetical protein
VSCLTLAPALGKTETGLCPGRASLLGLGAECGRLDNLAAAPSGGSPVRAIPLRRTQAAAPAHTTASAPADAAIAHDGTGLWSAAPVASVTRIGEMGACTVASMDRHRRGTIQLGYGLTTRSEP